MDPVLLKWAAIALLAALVITAYLWGVACDIRDSVDIHQLRVDVVVLQNRYMRHIKRLREGKKDGDADELGDVDILDDDPADAGDPRADAA